MDPKKTAIGVAAGLALGGVFGYHAIYKSQQKQLHALNQTIEVEQVNQKAQEETAILLEKVRRFRNHLLPAPDTSWLMQHAATVSRGAGLELTSISPEVPQPFGQFTRVAINLSFNADYHQIGQFLDALERADYFIRVERLSISRTNDAKGAASTQLTLSALYAAPTIWGK